MTTRQPRHRAVKRASGARRFALRVPSRHRAVIAAAGAVFCALLVLALATLPGRRHSADGTGGGSVIAQDAATSTDAGRPAAIAPPTSISRGPTGRTAAQPPSQPALGQLPRPGVPGVSPTTSHSASPPGSGPAPGAPSVSAQSSPRAAAAPGTSPGSSASSGSSLPSSSALATSDPAQIAQAVFDAINASRQAAGLHPLAWSGGLQASAHQHNLAMAQSDALSHQLPGEASLGQRESDAGIDWSWAGENIGQTSDLTANGALGLETAMVNEKPPDDGHRRNILSGRADIVGIDVLIDTANHLLWLTEDFAQT